LYYRTIRRGVERRVGTSGDLELQERMVALVRAFGLHRPDETPCGKPVSVAEAHALMELSRGSGPLVQKELAARLRLEKSTVSRLVGMLEGRGWVGRRRCSTDGRALEVSLTDAGRKAAAEIAGARRAKFARVLEAIPESERASVLAAMKTLEEAMNAARD
jgi:DNA-binding MarR family transcriptional regulator